MVAGPTGGYIIGYIPAAFIAGYILEKFKGNDKVYLYCIAMLTGSVMYFTLGTIWFILSTGMGLGEALMVCVIPFIPGDLLKIAAAALLSKRIRHIVLARR